MSEIHVHDTTYHVMQADTTGIGVAAGYSYHWTYYDGSTYSGPSVRLPVTVPATSFAYTLAVTGPGGSGSCSGAISSLVVFNCATLHAYTWSDGAFSGSPFAQPSSANASSFILGLTGFNPGDDHLLLNMQVDWGNGTTITKTRPDTGTFISGGFADTAHGPAYIYSGQYKIAASYRYTYDTMTCPVVQMPRITTHAFTDSLLPPTILGGSSVCAGDTLRLQAADVTPHFFNLPHMADTTGTVADYWPQGYSVLPHNSSIRYRWYDRVHNLLSADTILKKALTIADTGAYYLNVTDTISHALQEIAVHVTVDSGPPVVGAIAGNPLVCVSSTTTLTSSTPGGTWSSSSPCAIVMGGLVTGIFTGVTIISYTVYNSCGSATDTMQVTVYPVLHVGNIAGTPSVCEDAETTLSNGVAGGTWTSSSANATVNDGIVSGVTAGTAVISYTLGNFCGSETDTMMVTIRPKAQPGTIVAPDTVCIGKAVTFTEDQPAGLWNSSMPHVGNINFAGVFRGVAEGTTLVNYLVNNSCGFAVASHSIYVSASGVCDTTIVYSAYRIYPNPTLGNVTIEMPQSGEKTILISDMSGRILKRFEVGTAIQLADISIGELPAGVYIITVNAGGSRYRGKIVKL